jgi:hypothetical protein
MADLNLGIGIIAEMKEFEKSLATVPGIGAKEARDMVTGIRKELKGAEKAGKDTAAKISSGFSSEFNKVSSGAAALAGAVGGPFARIASLANSALKPIAEASAGLEGTSGALVAMGGAAAAGAAGALLAAGAVAKLASGAVELGQAAGAAGERLKGLGLLTEDEARFAHEMAQAAEGAAVQQDLLTVRLAHGIEAVGEMTEAWTGLKAELAKGAGRIGEAGDAVEDFRHRVELSIPVVGGFLEKFDELVGPGQGNVGVLVPVNAILKDLAQSGREAAPELDRAREALTKLITLGNQGIVHHDEHVSVVDVLVGDPADLKASTAALEEAARNRSEMLAQVEAEQAQTEKITGLHWLKLDASHAQYTVDVAADEHDLTLQLIGENAARKRSDDQALKDKLTAYRVAAEAAAGATANIAGSFASLESSIASGFQARVDAGEQLTIAQVRQGNEAIRTAEVLQIAQAGLTAAITAASGIASLQAAGVPPPIAIPLGIAEGASLYAATVAGIRSHRPISFSWHGPGSGSAGSSSTPVDTDGDGRGDTAAAVAAKGGSVAGATDRGRGGRGGGGAMVTVDRRLGRLVVTSGEPGKRPRPGGRRR